jgi:hypothetical protein
VENLTQNVNDMLCQVLPELSFKYSSEYLKFNDLHFYNRPEEETKCQEGLWVRMDDESKENKLLFKESLVVMGKRSADVKSCRLVLSRASPSR